MMSSLVALSIDQIETSGRIRQIDPDQVDRLRASITTVGLLNPITVCSLGGGKYRLVAGAHRLEACRAASMFDIAAQVLDLTDLEMVIAECDENLCGTQLSAVDRATFLAKRKEAYEALYPETRHGTPGVSRQVGDTGQRIETERFTADVAAKTGQSERSVQRAAERGEKVISEVLDMIRGTALDTGAYLDKIKRLPPNEQMHAARRDLAARRASAAAPHETNSITDDFDPMAVRTPQTLPPAQEERQLPTAREMGDAVNLLCDLRPADFLDLCPPAKRPTMCQKLVHLIETFDKVREAVGS